MISIVVPALNEEKYLSKCLESLKNQDYKGKYEIIVVDNGSTDNTVKIAKKHGVKVVSCPKKGVVYARNLGANVCSGDIIVQADADAVYPRNWLTRIAKHFSLHPEAVGLTGNYIYRDPPYWAKAEYFLRNFINMLTVMIFGRPFWVSGANFSFRRQAFIKIDGYKENSFQPDQYDISTRLSKLGKISYDKELSVLTSSRRVQKPFFNICIDIMLNLFKFFSHIFKSSITTLQTPIIKLPSIRTSIKIMPPVLMMIGFLLYGYFVPPSQVFGKVYYKANSSEKVIALTFDDGPNEPYTSQILDILNHYGVKATFFVIGKNVELYPETAKRIVADGHALEDHSYTHNANHALKNSCNDIKLAQATIHKIAGVVPHLYRPPHGRKSPWELNCVKKANMTVVTWSDSTNELHSKMIFGKPSPEQVAKNVIRKAGPGKIILLHDGYGICHNCSMSDKSLTVKALPIIIENLQNQGYRFVTVPELLGIPAYNS